MILALTGPKTVGKTTLAIALTEALDIPVTVLSFASPIRSMLGALGVDAHHLHVEKEAPIDGLGQSARELLQSLGTEWGRGMVHDQIWLWAMDQQIRRALANGKANGEADLLILIDDCRFPNEASFIAERHGKVVALSRAGIEYTGEHASERPIPCSQLHASVDCGDIPAAVAQIRELLA